MPLLSSNPPSLLHVKYLLIGSMNKNSSVKTVGPEVGGGLNETEERNGQREDRYPCLFVFVLFPFISFCFLSFRFGGWHSTLIISIYLGPSSCLSIKRSLYLLRRIFPLPVSIKTKIHR